MVAPALRALLQNAEHAGVHEGAEARLGTAEHAVCGDVVQLSVRADGTRVLDVRWRAQGCPATVAVAALAAKTWRDVGLADAGAALHAALGAHGGLAAHERHAEALVLRALSAAVGG